MKFGRNSTTEKSESNIEGGLYVNQSVTASTVQMMGAWAFGFVIGWYLYYVNRYRQSEVKLTDLVTLIGAVGGGAVLALFPARTDLFGAYGIGLFCGFIIYFIILFILVYLSPEFIFFWFLDVRCKRPVEPYYIPEGVATPSRPPMEREGPRMNT